MTHDPDGDESYGKYRDKLMRIMAGLNKLFGPDGLPAGKLRKIRVVTPKHPGGDVMVVVKATVDGQRLVGFITGDDVEAALSAFVNKVRSPKMQWKIDEWAAPPSE